MGFLTEQRAGSRNGGAGAGGSVNVHRIERVASVAGGGALAIFGLTRRSRGGVALALLGGGLVVRGATGVCHIYKTLGVSTAPGGERAVTVERAATIDKPAAELYRYWRNFENLPRFMQHLESVTVQGDRRSHWVAKAPLGKTVEWDAEITEERENELIAWRSLPGADVESKGEVRFTPAPHNRGTEIHVTLTYNPPAGAVGAVIAKLAGEEPEIQVREDLRHLKHIMEAGEVPTTDGQPSGRE